VRHRRDTSTYACRNPASTSTCRRLLAPVHATRIPAIAQGPMNVPRTGVVNARRPGPVPGRSGAKSIDDAEHGARLRCAMGGTRSMRARGTVSPTKLAIVLANMRGDLSGVMSGGTGPRTRARGRRVLPAQTDCTDSDTRHGRRWRERPRLQGPGATVRAGHRGRSRHRWFSDCDTDSGSVGGTERRLDDPPAASCCDRNACTQFAVMGLPGVRECLERPSKVGGQPDAIFA